MFSDKFHLLNSQEHSDDINWSSSSSEQDDIHKSNTVHKIQHRKRKRSRPVSKNTSNLKVVIVDRSKDTENRPTIVKSPILSSKGVKRLPILTSNHTIRKSNFNSPVLNRSYIHKSPIISPKYASPRLSVKVRKKLFCVDKKCSNKLTYCDNYSVKKTNDVDNCISNNNLCEETNAEQNFEKIKSLCTFMDSNFSSDNASQCINDTPTPENSSISDEIEILSCKSQDLASKCVEGTSRNQSDSSSCTDTNSKKVRHKKGGLVNRLNMLLKKHNANINLWQHERFLATNSNFVIPKEDHSVFYIQKISFKYGCYLLEVMDKNDEKYLILINNVYVKCNLSCDSLLKLYEPFRILDHSEDCKLIINVCKFEIVDFKKELLE